MIGTCTNNSVFIIIWRVLVNLSKYVNEGKVRENAAHLYILAVNVANVMRR